MLTDSQIKALIAHLSDYVALMEYMWPNEEDVIKSKAKALLHDVRKATQSLIDL